jgi:hypothetical protein
MDCFTALAMTGNDMRRFLTASFAIVLSACAARPEQPAATPSVPPPVQPLSEERSGLSGLTTQDLVGRFGTPALQIREGGSLKLQFRGLRCVLDAYLYPSGGSGVLKVTHVDTRAPSGTATDQAACIFALRRAAS